MPVLAGAAIAALVPEPGEKVIVDATLGAAGHAERILEALGPSGRLIGIDRDPDALAAAGARLARFGDRVRLVAAPFSELEDVVKTKGWDRCDGVLWDLGISSMHVDRPERGFSFRHDAPLDMRMDPTDGPSAADVLNTYSERDLTTIIRTYGEERWAARIAQFIVAARARRRISTTLELVEIIRAAVPAAARRGGPHRARRTFQALRIEVNDELGELQSSLPQAVEVTEPGGRLVAISYHSLEDRIVKRFFNESSRAEVPRLRVITRKPVRASDEEVETNPRASSALMRAAERLASPPVRSTGPEGSAA